MKLRLILFATTLIVVEANVFRAENKNIHAVLVSAAEKDTCNGYAMDSEIAHTYHTLIDNGVPPSNIILFLNNGIANLSECSPWPGHLYTDLNHTKDYLPGLKIDYSGDDVSVDNVLAVLRGEKHKVSGGSGRVLKSKKDDHVFVFHSGHGVKGAFFISLKYLTTKQLNDAFKKMQKKHMFKELLFYASTCCSGSMFDGKLKNDGNIFAVSDANPDEDSRSICKSTGSSTYVCIAGEFGAAFLHDIDNKNLNKEHISTQYEYIKKNVPGSTVCKYGNQAISKEFSSNFEGSNNVSKPLPTYDIPNILNTESLPRSPIVHYLISKKHLAMNPNSLELKNKVLELEQERKEIKQIAIKIVASFFDYSFNFIENPIGRITQDECHHKMIKTIEQKCPKILKSPFIGEFIDPMINLCEELVNETKLMEKIAIECI